MIRTAMAGLVAASLSIGTAQAAGPVAFDGSWRTQSFSLFSSNTYRFQGNAVSMSSDGAVSLAYRRLDPAFWSSQSAAWSWQVAESVPATDLRRKGGDDRNLAMYFVFLPPSVAEDLKGANVRRVLRNDAARVLVYVWGGDHARGSVLESPYLGSRGRTIVLRGAGTGSASERVDLARDYARLFGSGEAALVGLALSGDSDDTETRIRAQVSGLTLK